MAVPERFILVDDCEADNVYHEIVIRRAGFTGEVLVFENGLEALDFLRNDPFSRPSCLLLDIHMPQMSGFELARRATPLLRDKPPVIVKLMSTSDTPSEHMRASDLPLIKEVIIKPLRPEDVKAVLQMPA